MIVKNEEKHLGACLDSVRDMVNEMIIVDTGSTDHTIEIAEEKGAEVYHFEWINDFSVARNYALEQATNPWILQLDADEELIESTSNWFYDTYPWAGHKGFLMTINNLAHEDFDEVFMSHQLIRFFRNDPTIRYENRIHENINLPSNSTYVGSAEASIVHKGYGDESAKDKRKNRNRQLLLQDLEEDPDNPIKIAYLAQHYGSTGEIEKAYEYAKKALKEDLDVYPLRPVCLRFLLYYNVQQMDKAKFEQDAADISAHDFPELLFYRGVFAQRKENWEEAYQFYEQFLEKVYALPKDKRLHIVSNDNLRNAYLNLAAQATHKNQSLQVIEYLQKAADISPTFYKLKADLGENYLKVGNFEKAYQTFSTFKSQLQQMGTEEEKSEWLPVCEQVLEKLESHIR
jgi:glycosyltransferase involved in cell wall biosynthesis